MRIIAGKFKNRSIDTPEGEITRPILSRIRKSLFDILQPHLKDAQVLDLFCGSGVMTIEAFSRGAVSVVSVEADARAYETAQKNLKKVCPNENYQLLRGDVLEWVPKLAKQGFVFDVIGITPPYGTDLNNQTLRLIDKNPSLLRPETVIYIQRDKREDVQLEWKNLEHVRSKDYGRTIFEFFLPPENE